MNLSFLARISILSMALLPSLAGAQRACQHVKAGRTSLVYGARHAFLVQAPPGWVGVVVAGIPAAFHRTSESWQDGAAVLYVNTFTADSGPAVSPEEAFHKDSSQFAAKLKSLIVERQSTLQTADGRIALVWAFRGETPTNVEVVAYVREKTVTPLIVMSARTEVEYRSALKAFRTLVRSYEFITANQRAGDGPPCGITRR
jgi:hypothetical protein